MDELRNALVQYKKISCFVGLGAVGSYLLALFAFQLAPVSYVIAVRELSVVFGVILAGTLLKENISAVRMLSALLITMGAILIKTL
jgi:uncharacterized membrane protein